MSRNNVISDRVGYGVVSGLTAFQADAGKQMSIHSLGVYNATTGDTDAGLAQMFNTSSALVYENTVTPVAAADARNPVPTSGLVLVSTRRIEFITWASMTGTPVIKYWDGSAFQTITAIASTTDVLIFNNPVDQAKGSSYSGLSQASYHYQLTGITAVTELKLCRLLGLAQSLGSKQFYELNFPESKGKLLCEAEEGIIPYFKDADDNNVVQIYYQQNG